MKEAMFYEKLENQDVKCFLCAHHCLISKDKRGICGVRENKDGVLYSLVYGKLVSMNIDPIEKKPLFHFYPGTLCFSVGGWGCNFHCKHCQNWEISMADGRAPGQNCQEISPQVSIDLAKQYHCQGIAWTYNEPTIWFEYTLDTAKLARENGLYTVYVTNGYANPETLDTIGPYLDAWRVDIKGFSDEFYRALARIPHWREILEVTRRAKNKWHMHVEVVTNIIPTMNDDDQQLEGIAQWIRNELGELTPWHVTRFYPQHDMKHLPPTPVETIERACGIGRKAGLKFIYAGNVPGHQSESTRCYACGKLNVQRFGYQTSIKGLDGSKCRFCGAELNFRVPGSKEG